MDQTQQSVDALDDKGGTFDSLDDLASTLGGGKIAQNDMTGNLTLLQKEKTYHLPKMYECDECGVVVGQPQAIVEAGWSFPYCNNECGTQVGESTKDDSIIGF